MNARQGRKVRCRIEKGRAWQGRIGEDRKGCVVHYVMEILEG
jgi:hypothetical protein